MQYGTKRVAGGLSVLSPISTLGPLRPSLEYGEVKG